MGATTERTLMVFAFMLALLSTVYGAYNDDYAYEEADVYADGNYYDNDEESAAQSAENSEMVGYDDDGVGFVTVSLYGLLIWQFMSLSFGMCLCGGITMCYNRFSQPNKTQTQW